MARGIIRIKRTYRTYSFTDKNPVIDKMRTIIQDEGLFKSLSVVHEISGVATTTLNNWFHGDTKSPQHHTIAAVITALGYEETFQKVKDIDVEKERVAARAWNEKQDKKKAKANAK